MTNCLLALTLLVAPPATPKETSWSTAHSADPASIANPSDVFTSMVSGTGFAATPPDASTVSSPEPLSKKDDLWLSTNAPPASVVSAATPPMSSASISDLSPPTTVETLPVASTVATPITTLSDAQLYRLRLCESTDNYSAHLVWGTTFESRATGAYQFEQPTWDGVAARHMPWLVGVKPHLAWPAEQDAMTRWLYSERGRAPWPVCGSRI